MSLIWADGGYAGKLIGWGKDHCGWVLEIVKRSDDVKGLPESSESMIYAGMIHLMVRLNVQLSVGGKG